jgi:hypothetical protein
LEDEVEVVEDEAFEEEPEVGAEEEERLEDVIDGVDVLHECLPD